MLKPFLLCSAAILFALTPAPTPGRTPQEAAPAPVPVPAQAAAPAPSGVKNPIVKPTAEGQAKAKSLYAIDCAMCHGDNGNGQTDLATSMELKLEDWSDPKTLADKQDENLFDTIRKGKDKMPPEAEGRATDNDVWNLILYIRGLSHPQPLVPEQPEKPVKPAKPAK
jgi:high-affinity iron transporter